MKKIVLYLLNEKGYSVLENLIKKNLVNQIKYIVIGKDLNLKNDYSKEMENFCRANSIKYYFKNSDIPEYKGVKVAIGWRWLIKDSENLVVLHDSLLPKYRGFAPLVTALINGDKELGVTALIATKEYDKGDIIGQKKIQIEYPLKIQTAIEKISKLYISLVLELLEKIGVSEKIERISQNEEEATYSIWRDENDYCIDWSMEASKIQRTVDALGEPYQGASSEFNGKEVIIKDVEIVKDVEISNRNKNIGKVIFVNDGKPVVICGKGLIQINEACDKEKNISIIPLKKFRSRFQ